MVAIIKSGDQALYQCEECTLHYEEEEWAEKCEAWCKQYDSCNLTITAYAEERKKEARLDN